MAKTKATGKAKAKPKAKPKAIPRRRRLAAAAIPGRRGILRRRRPAAAEVEQEAGRDEGPLARWQAGQAIKMEEAAVEWLLGAPGLVVEEAYYFHKMCRVAG